MAEEVLVRYEIETWQPPLYVETVREAIERALVDLRYVSDFGVERSIDPELATR